VSDWYVEPSTLELRRAPPPRWARACYDGSFLMTGFAVVNDNVTLTTGDHTAVCVLACGGATVAIALAALAWRKMTAFRRYCMALFLVVDGWVLLDAGGLRLLGWS